MTAAAESRSPHNPALSETQVPESDPISQERIRSAEAPSANAEQRAALHQRVRQLQAEDLDTTGEKLASLRQQLFGDAPDRVILQRTVTTAIPEGAVRAARSAIVAHRLQQKGGTREWNKEEAPPRTAGPVPAATFAKTARTAHFPAMPAEEPAPVPMFKAKTAKAEAPPAATAIAARRQKAMQRARADVSTIAQDVDDAFERIAPKGGKRLKPPTPTTLPSSDASR